MNVFDKSLYMVAGKVAGVKLRPLSAFQVNALMLIDSPYIHGASQPSWGDTVAALMICQSSVKDGIGKVLRFQSGGLSRLAWRFKLLFRNHSFIIEMLQAHIATYFDYPEVWSAVSGEGQSVSKSTGAPWTYFLVSVMWQETGIPLNTLWDMSLLSLSCHKAIRDELTGGAEIATALLEEREANKNG